MSPLKHPVIGRLTLAALISKLGRGGFFAVSVIYMTTFLHFDPARIAVILTVSNGLGIVASAVAGHLSDLLSARRLQISLTLVYGVALMAYPLMRDFWSLLIMATLATVAERGANSAQSSIIARALTGPNRVTGRAVMRTAVNVGIAVGSSLAAIPLVLGTEVAMQLTLGLAGVAVLASTLLLRQLPASADAPRLTQGTTPEPTSAGTAPGSVPGDGAALTSEAATSPSFTAATTSPRSPYRDLRYVTMAVLAGIFAMQFAVAESGIPQWIHLFTQVPVVVVSILLVTNTILVILLQIPLSRGTDDLNKAGRAAWISGVLMAAACAFYAFSASTPVPVAIGLLLGGMVLHTFAEIYSSAAAWGLSFELADQRRAGTYQGIYSTSTSLGITLAPALITLTVLTLGAWGWAILGAVFLVAALGLWRIAATAARQQYKTAVGAAG